VKSSRKESCNESSARAKLSPRARYPMSGSRFTAHGPRRRFEQICVGRAVWVDSQATSKGATKETRERAERANAFRGSARATVVAEEDTHTARPAH
jgi:hypothetical protein